MKEIRRPSDEARDRIESFLSERRVLTLATAADGEPWNCTLAFAPDDDLDLYFLSDPSTRHCREIATDPRVAVALHDADTVGDRSRARGLQAVGTATRLHGASTLAGLVAFARRFETSFSRLRDAVHVGDAGVYRVELEQVWLLDRERLGGRLTLSLDGEDEAGDGPNPGAG